MLQVVNYKKKYQIFLNSHNTFYLIMISDENNTWIDST